MIEKKLWIKTKCLNKYKLLNKISDIGVSIYDIKEVNDYIYIKVLDGDYEKIKKFIISFKFDKVYNSGFYKIINSLKENYLFTSFTIIGIILVFIFNNLIINVVVLHENSDLRKLIIDEVAFYNIKPLNFSKSFNELTEIKNEILLKYPETIDWLEIEKDGMDYIIRVEDRLIPSDSIEEDYCNIYATKNGVITGITVQRGVAAVSIGDYVKVGDLLVTGDILLEDEVKEQVCALGVIRAEVWYETNIKLPFEYFEDTETGKYRYNFVVNYENTDTRILNDRVDEYVSAKTLLFDLFGYKFYLEKQIEVERVYKRYTEDALIEEALRLADEKILLTLNEKDEILMRKVLKKTVNNSTIDIDVFIVTEENIN